MEVTIKPTLVLDSTADVVLVAASPRWRSDTIAALDQRLDGGFSAEIKQQGFTGAAGEAVLFQTHGRLPARSVWAVGIGDGMGPMPWYKLAEATVRRAADLKALSAAVVLPQEHVSADVLEIVVEGLHLAAYTFDRLKSQHRKRPPALQRVAILVRGGDARWRSALACGGAMARAACSARDLINLPAAVVTPTYLATEARRLARHQRLQLRVLDRPALKRIGMGALLGVAQGSAQPPRFIELIYRPSGTARRTPRRRVALAGKGITFDSGGLSLKPADAMQTQKRDMAGAAAVLGVMSVIRDLALPVEVRAYVPSTENMPGAAAIKPGDVLRAYNGTSIEVLNTDAEGRLVLADALSYAAAAKPDVLIDLATLTAAVRTALGTRYAAIMGTDQGLVRALIAAAQACGENLWELPLVAEYRSDLDSSVADIKNIGEGGAAGTIIGALFLREFVGDLPWAHIDFSSTAMTDKPLPCHPRGATGFGVRTLLRYLRGLGG
jgi:leucyl aminopeptidase